MKRSVILLLLLTFASSSVSDAQKRKSGPSQPAIGKVFERCPENLTDILDCPLTGCGPSVDPNLNKRKNIRSDDQPAASVPLEYLKSLPDPVAGYNIGDPRDKLAAKGEGKKVTVIAFVLVVRKGSSESCNCGLLAPKDTDNNIVLVDRGVTNPTLAKNEDDSVTAELTPRVRLDHPGLARDRLAPLIAYANGALLVRVTGLLMFDSEHSLGRHLRRHNNWEIHPVLGMDYCPKGNCNERSDDGWKSVDQ